MIQHRILYSVLDEDGNATAGRYVGPDDVRAYLEYLRKRFRDAQYIYCELEDEFDDELSGDNEQQLLGLD